MFWQFLIAAAIAVGLIQFGAMVVWVQILSGALQVVLISLLVVVVCGALLFVWRRYRERITQNH